MATIKHNLTIAASMEKVYAAVTTMEGLSGWRKASDFYGLCNFHWGRFMVSLSPCAKTARASHR